MQDGTESMLRAIVEGAAAFAGSAALVTLFLAGAVAALLHRSRVRRMVTLPGRVVPAAARHTVTAAVAAATLALAAATPAAAHPAGTEPGTTEITPRDPRPPASLRAWLTQPAGPDDDPGPGATPPAPASAPATTTTTTTTAPATTSAVASPVTTTTTVTTPAPTRIAAAPGSRRDPVPPTLVPPAVLVNPEPVPGSVVVHPGDCLWTIAAARLAPGATNAEIDRAWRAIWAANRDRIGTDPNLIHPGLTLVMPASVH